MICVNLVDRTEPTTITDMAEKNNIPIIFFNRELVAEDLERWSKPDVYKRQVSGYAHNGVEALEMAEECLSLIHI